MFKIIEASPKFSEDFFLVLRDFVWKLSEISSESFNYVNYTNQLQISFIFLGNFFKDLGTFLLIKNFLGNIQISFSLKYQTSSDIAAHLVTKTISWQVLGNISNFSRNLSLFFLNFYIFPNVSIDS